MKRGAFNAFPLSFWDIRFSTQPRSRSALGSTPTSVGFSRYATSDATRISGEGLSNLTYFKIKIKNTA